MNAILKAFLKWNADTSSNEAHLSYTVCLTVDERLVFPEGLRQKPCEFQPSLGSQTIKDTQSTWEDEKNDSVLFKFHFPLKFLVLREGSFSYGKHSFPIS